jgi:hypothetical protein
MTSTDPRTQAALDAAIHHIRTTVAQAAMRVGESLGAAAAATTRIVERDNLLATQQELRRNAGHFEGAFQDALREKIKQELAPRDEPKRKLASADWQTLTLVEDSEVEARMNFERIGQMISHECESQLRELAAYMGTLTGIGRADEDRNPLRADIIGAALYRGIEALTDNADSRKILARELGQAMAHAMPDAYAEILRGLQQRGVQPVHLTVRTVEGPGVQLGAANSGYATLPASDRVSTRSGHGELGEPSGGSPDFDLMYEHRRALAAAEAEAATHAVRSTSGSSGPGSGRWVERHAMPTAHAPAHHVQTDYGPGDVRGVRGRITSDADQQLMTLLRRLTAGASRGGEFTATPADRAFPEISGFAGRGPDTGSSVHGPGGGGGPRTGRGAAAEFVRSGAVATSGGSSTGASTGLGGAPVAYAADGLTGLMAVNLIRAHRDELLKASTGKLDHMVIDVVGSLFDQILSDTRVPPQMARQIARLQLPVLRVALNDQTFFSTRRHPVRRFINRIASLACPFEDFDDGPGKEFLARVAQLVQEIVEGDFDQIDLYASKLAELERFIGDQAEGAVARTGAAHTLATKESELRVQQRYMQQLQAALAPMQLPGYLADFLPQVWSQALMLAVRQEGPDSDRATRFRRVGRDLVMSIQPKGSPAFRKKFLMQLPPLMKDLNEGMQLIGWPEQAQREFFGKLLPAHAESLKGAPMSELDHNLMAKQLDTIFATPIPGLEAISAFEKLPEVEEAAIERKFSPEEAQQVGLVQESAVDWDGQVDIDIDISGDDGATTTTSAPTTGADSATAALAPTSTSQGDPGLPSRGPALMEHIKVGFAYQMHLKDEWQKVRLAHVSTGRNFFVFTRGAKHQETISMTSRMLARMCETGRMRAVESAYLMERATQRARKQLAELKTGTTRH